MLLFEWDEHKNRLNRRKHGVSFQAAQRVFEDPCALMLLTGVEAGEERWQAIGRAGRHTVLVVAHVVHLHGTAAVIRIIAARRALKREK